MSVERLETTLRPLHHYTNSPGAWGALASQRRGTASYFYGFDPQGNARFLTDAAGAVTDRYGYTAFGEEREATGATENPHRFGGQAGYYRDAADRQYARARHLDPELARWLSVDPLKDERPR